MSPKEIAASLVWLQNTQTAAAAATTTTTTAATTRSLHIEERGVVAAVCLLVIPLVNSHFIYKVYIKDLKSGIKKIHFQKILSC